MKTGTIKILAVALAVIQVLFLKTTVTAKQFSDVSFDNTDLDGINYMTDNGYIKVSGTFSPDTATDRITLVYALYCMAGKPNASASLAFTDLPSDTDYVAAIKWAVSNGITNGVSATLFAPNNTVKRQDIATFLYRFTSYMEYNTHYVDSGLLDVFTDSDSISGYALPAVKWAVYQGLMNGTTTTTFTPAGTMKRAYFTRLIMRFNQNIAGFNPDREAYGFANSGNNFPLSLASGEYYTSSLHRELLVTLLEQLGAGETEVSNCLSLLDQVWEGSCFGISLTAVLDRLGRINASSSDLISLTTLSGNSDLESMINVYQALQEAQTIYSPELKTITAESMELLIDVIDENGFAIFPYTISNTSAHAVILYDYQRLVDSGYYQFTAYDNRCPGQEVLFSFEIDEQELFNTGVVSLPDGTSETVRSFGLVDATVLNSVSSFDLDGFDNDGTMVGSGSMNEYISENDTIATTLYVESTDEFSITNAEGERLIYQNGAFSGTMDLLRCSLSVCSPDTPFTWILQVEDSAWYRYEGDGISADFSMVSEEQFLGIAGNGVKSITINGDGGLSVEGDEYTYRASIYVGMNGLRQIDASGRGTGCISFERSVSGITSDTNGEPYTVSAYRGTSGKDVITVSGVTEQYEVSLYDEEIVVIGAGDPVVK